MYRNRLYRNADEALPSLLKAILEEGEDIPSRAGETKEFTHLGITLMQPLERELLCDHRKPNLAAQVAETMWVLAGRDDMEFLSRYLPRAKDFSDDGLRWRAGYGARLRRWEGHGFTGGIRQTDQLAYVVKTLQENPLSRQAVMSIWDPNIDTQPGKDIPCNDWLHFLSRGRRLDLHVAVRSNDAIWGWSGINAFEWSALLEVVAGLTHLEVGALHFSVTSWHLYEHHYTKAAKIAASTHPVVQAKPSPRFACTEWARWDELCKQWFDVEERIRTGDRVHNHDRWVADFPDPMLQSWLRVLQWWWSGDLVHLKPHQDTRLYHAALMSVQPKVQPPGGDFVQHITALHNEKHKAYGDSWKRRGEMLGIMANIARKVDRLGGGDTKDETSADTAGDLLVYLAKYRVWLDEQTYPSRAGISDNPIVANVLIRRVESEQNWSLALDQAEDFLRESFDSLERAIMGGGQGLRLGIVDAMLPEAFNLAQSRWLGFVGGDYDLP